MLKQLILKVKVLMNSLLYMLVRAETPCLCLGVTLKDNLTYSLILKMITIR